MDNIHALAAKAKLSDADLLFTARELSGDSSLESVARLTRVQTMALQIWLEILAKPIDVPAAEPAPHQEPRAMTFAYRA